MLSIYTLKSASDASTYYQQGDYYTEAGVQEYSFWWGKGAKVLGLQGSVDFKVFKELLEGHLPNQIDMTQTKNGQYHRPGYDLTFSAPKSVSILALVLGNKEVLQAHRESVKEVLAYLEQNYAAFRAKKPGRTDIEKSGNYTVSGFEHSDSRAGDPNLHTHAILMNMTQRADGAWRALYADNLYTDKLLNGMEYRSLLARKLLSLGFELEFKEKGLFEIVGVPEPLMKHWSKRRDEIEKWLEENNLSGGEAAIHANFQTRTKKNKQTIEARMETWQKELKASGFSLDELQAVVNEAKARGPVQPPDPYVLAQYAVNSAIHHLSERQPLFSIEEVIKTAKRMSVLPSSEGDFLKVIEEKIHSKTLLYVKGKQLTTPEMIELQQKTIESLKGSKDSVDRIMAPWIADIMIGFKVKTEQEGQALKEIFTHSDNQVLVSAYSRTALLTLLKNFKDMVENQGYYPRFLTQTQMGVETLKEKLNSDRVSTITGFLLSCEMRAQKQKSFLPEWFNAWDKRVREKEGRDIWVINGTLSADEFNRLQQWSKHFGARLILSKTKNQQSPLFSFLKENGILEIHLNSNQKEEVNARVALLEKLEAFEKANTLHVVEDYKERLQKAVDLYSLHSQLIVLNNTERIFLNEHIRNQLKEKGVLQGQGVLLPILQPLSFSKTEKNQAHLYQLNDVIRFNQAQKSLGIEKDDYFKIKEVQLSQGKISLQGPTGKIVEWELSDAKSADVFREDKREVMVGDELVWTRTLKNEKDKSLDRIKNQKTLVTAIQGNTMTIVLSNGKRVHLNTTEFREQHWDYGYATLLKNVGGKIPSHTIAVLSSHKMDDQTVSFCQELFNQKGENKYTVLCGDVEKLKNVLRTGIEGGLPLFPQEIPYERKEALAKEQTTVTQSVFYRLQGEYLNIRKQNPEFLEKNIEKSLVTRKYSAEFRAACYAVETVILYHSERDAVFPLEKLKKESREMGGLQLSRRALEGAINFSIKKGWLMVIPQENPEKDLVAARHTVLMEKICIQKMKEGQNQIDPIISSDSPLIKAVQANTRLTKGQKEAVALMLTSVDKMSAVQGIAGAGKTTALKEVRRLCMDANFKSLVLANTGSAKSQAEQSSGIASQTTAQFLTRVETLVTLDIDKAKKEYGDNQLIIVDESSLMATKEQFRLTTLVEQLGARLNFIGDFKQQGSIGAGTSLRDLLAYGVNKVAMTENVRLKDAKALEAMKKAYAGDMAGVLTTLRDTIEEIPDKKEALTRIVNIYMAMQKKGREHILIITPLNEDRQFVNNAIREKLKKSKELTGRALTTSVFLPRDRREVDKRETARYKVDDFIRFNTHHPRLGIKAGDYLRVVNRDLKYHRLTLQGDSGQSFYWAPKNLKKVSDIEIYRQEKRELMKNDTIIFKRNQETKGIFNGDKATILDVIGNHQIEALLANGKSIILDLNKRENQHLDYGYALTTFVAQGRDVVLVLAYGEGPKPYLRKISDLKVGDKVVLTREDQKQGGDIHSGHSVVGEVVNIEGFKMTIRKEDKLFPVTTTPERLWSYFPPFEDRKEYELPLSTSQQALIVDITRGDLVYAIVPYIPDFQKTLERHQTSKQSALSVLDPRHSELNQGVNRMVENIQGKAEPAVVQPTQHSLAQEATIKSSTVKRDAYIDNVKPPARFSNFEEPKRNFIDKDVVNAFLERDMVGNASKWLGDPTRVTGREVRWGSKGSLCLTLSGAKAGLWKNHETGDKGKGLISLYMAVYGIMGWKEALKDLAYSHGLLNGHHRVDWANTPKAPAKPKIKELTEEDRINFAKTAYQKAIPITGTLAEKYLRTYRGITGELPGDFRFSKATKHLDTKKFVPALIAPIRDKNGVMTGIVRIFLNKDGSKLKDTYINAKGEVKEATDKANLGVVGEGAVVVQQGELATTLWVAEGIETALSIAKAVPNQTVMASISVDQFKKISISPEVQKIVICADKDEAGSNTPKSVMDAVEHHLLKGRRVFISIPDGVDKCDFNDLLKQGGLERVKAILDNKVEIKKGDFEFSKIKGADFLERIESMKGSLKQEVVTPSPRQKIEKEVER